MTHKCKCGKTPPPHNCFCDTCALQLDAPEFKVGCWYVHQDEDDDEYLTLAKVIAPFSGGFVIGFSDSVNECWCTAIIDTNGKERGPTKGKLVRLATHNELNNDHCCGDR